MVQEAQQMLIELLTLALDMVKDESVTKDDSSDIFNKEVNTLSHNWLHALTGGTSNTSSSPLNIMDVFAESLKVNLVFLGILKDVANHLIDEHDCKTFEDYTDPAKVLQFAGIALNLNNDHPH